jgi:hypothetical protein
MRESDTLLIARLARDAGHGNFDPLVRNYLQRYGRTRGHAILTRSAELLKRAAKQLAGPPSAVILETVATSSSIGSRTLERTLRPPIPTDGRRPHG